MMMMKSSQKRNVPALPTVEINYITWRDILERVLIQITINSRSSVMKLT